MSENLNRDKNWIKTWLLIGVVMVLVQIVLGGVTRLTGSGLSITRWEIVTGTIPPMTAAAWDEAFALYKATPQYELINEGMNLPQFKFIFFWEYVHRLWARTMGFVFIIPFLFFWFRGSLRGKLLIRLAIVVVLSALAASFGWVMVTSGLIDRPWVNAYKLTMHLALGIAVFIALFYTWQKEKGILKVEVSKRWHRRLVVLIILVVIQIALGGFVSGMRASLVYPTWPLMHGAYLPAILLDTSHWNLNTFLMYDSSPFMPALVQFLHRNMAYLIVLVSVWLVYRWWREPSKKFHRIGFWLLGIIVVQVVLGIFTLLYSKGAIPVFLGAAHQGVGVILLTWLVYLSLRIKIY